jgi:hypothetical protein
VYRDRRKPILKIVHGWEVIIALSSFLADPAQAGESLSEREIPVILIHDYTLSELAALTHNISPRLLSQAFV